MFQISESVVVTGATAQVLGFADKKSYKYVQFLLNSETNVVFKVEDVTGDATADLEARGPFGRYVKTPGNAIGYDKTGGGTLYWSQSAGGTWPDGAINVRGGTLRLRDGEAGYYPNYDQTFYVGTNAVLELPFRNMVDLSKLPKDEDFKPSFVVDHGTLRIGCSATKPDNWGGGVAFAGRELTLDHATFICDMGGESGDSHLAGALYLGEKLTLKGDAAYVFSPRPGRWSQSAYHLYHSGGTEISVDDMTGDATPDALFDVEFRDYFDLRLDLDGDGKAEGGMRAGGFVKTGAGTMRLSRCGAYTGNCEVREGTLLLDCDNQASVAASGWTYLGDLSCARTLRVSTNAVLEIAKRGMLHDVSDEPVTDLLAMLEINGGTLRVRDNAMSVYGPLKLADATVDYGNGTKDWGPMGLAGSVTVGGGTRVDLPWKPGKSELFLTICNTNVVFNVADATGDAEVDFGIGLLVVSHMTNAMHSCGFVKRGGGTMELSCASSRGKNNRYLSGEVRVEAGTLLANCKNDLNSLSRLNVCAGAYVGGTGCVANVTLNAGAGLCARIGQEKGLSAKGSVALPSSGRINLIGVPDERLAQDVLVASGSLTGDVSGWTVCVNGENSARHRVAIRGKRLVARAVAGMTILVK